MKLFKTVKIGHLLVLFIFSVFSGFSQVNHQKNDFLKDSKHHIEAGNLNRAVSELVRLEKSNSLQSAEKYAVGNLLCKVYFMQQEHSKYRVQVEKNLQLAANLPAIYSAEVLSHKAFYFHYLMWQDSALYFSNAAMKILASNRKQLHKIETPFVYEVYAITFLYRRRPYRKGTYFSLPVEDHVKNMYQYFDSAIYYADRYPFKFSSDKAVLYRSYGNRWLDHVTNYRPFSKVQARQLTAFQWLSFQRANELYDKGLACLREQHANDIIHISSLKAMNYSNVGRLVEAENLLHQVFEKYATSNLFNENTMNYYPLASFLTVKMRNSIRMPYNRSRINADIERLEKLKPAYWMSFLKDDDLPYDPYSTSPYIALFNLYWFKSQHEKNTSELVQKAVSNLITAKVHFYYLKSGKYKAAGKKPLLSIERIQQKLKKREAFLLMHNDAGFLHKKQVLITRDTILLIPHQQKTTLNSLALDTLNFVDFKRFSYASYQANLKQVIRIQPNVTKIYLSYDDILPYEIMVRDTLAKHFSDLNYAGMSIQFVRLYNPYTYFLDKPHEARSNLDVRYLPQQAKTPVYFTSDFFKKYNHYGNFSHQSYTGNIEYLAEKQGVLHLYGHGELAWDTLLDTKCFQFSYTKNNVLKSENNLQGERKVNRDLVVLNNCFSGYPSFMNNEFNRTIPLHILSNGAKAVISSPNVVDDYFSSEFFKAFYANLNTKMSYEDAFFEAKKTFFLKHPEMREPYIWNGLQLLQTHRIYQSSTKSDNQIIWLVSLFCLLFFVILRRVQLHKRRKVLD
jgi:hypothetical protein